MAIGRGATRSSGAGRLSASIGPTVAGAGGAFAGWVPAAGAAPAWADDNGAVEATGVSLGALETAFDGPTTTCRPESGSRAAATTGVALLGALVPPAPKTRPRTTPSRTAMPPPMAMASLRLDTGEPSAEERWA